MIAWPDEMTGSDSIPETEFSPTPQIVTTKGVSLSDLPLSFFFDEDEPVEVGE